MSLDFDEPDSGCRSRFDTAKHRSAAPIFRCNAALERVNQGCNRELGFRHALHGRQGVEAFQRPVTMAQSVPGLAVQYGSRRERHQQGRGMTMDGKPRSDATLGKRLRHELVQYGLISVYLYVCFGAMLAYKSAILHVQGISYAPAGLAAVKALILAKFMLLGHAARLGERYRSRRLIYVIGHKSLLFLLLLLVLSVIEELVTGFVHGRPVSAVLAELGGSMLWQTLAMSLIMLLILIPYIAFGEVSAALGEGRLWQLLIAHRQGAAASGRAQLPPG
jgi:hypothetical protein